MSDAKINKFGKIFEDDNGDLNITDFHCDGGDRFKDTNGYVALLTLIKERIEDELKKFETLDSTSIQ